MVLLYWIVIFLCSLYVLIKSADYFIESTEEIGISLNIPSFILGATLVALGTSLPELITSSFAVFEGSTEIVVGNVVGSNTSNILLIIGVSIVFSRTFVVPFRKLVFDFIILMISAGLLTFFIWNGVFTKIEGIIFIVLMLGYLAYTVTYHREKLIDEEKPVKTKVTFGVIFLFVASCALISLSAKFTVDAIIKIAEILKTGEEIIALSILALGTSLPELAVSISAARKQQTDIILGNIIGSNVFNTFAVMGLPSLMKDLVISDDVLVFSVPMMLIATVLLFLISAFGRTASVAGVFFIVLYLLFVIGIFLEFRLF